MTSEFKSKQTVENPDERPEKRTKFLDVTNLKMTMSPPVRGHSRIKKEKTGLRKKHEKENLFAARSRVLKNRTTKDLTVCHNDTILEQKVMDEIRDPVQELQDKHIKVASNLLKRKYHSL